MTWALSRIMALLVAMRIGRMSSDDRTWSVGVRFGHSAAGVFAVSLISSILLPKP